MSKIPPVMPQVPPPPKPLPKIASRKFDGMPMTVIKESVIARIVLTPPNRLGLLRSKMTNDKPNQYNAKKRTHKIDFNAQAEVLGFRENKSFKAVVKMGGSKPAETNGNATREPNPASKAICVIFFTISPNSSVS
ncbi:MAG: hypothetical protein ABIJ21_04560 [Nanoarchaeota archaeon]